MTDRLTEIECDQREGVGCAESDVEWLIAEVKRLRRELRGFICEDCLNPLGAHRD